MHDLRTRRTPGAGVVSTRPGEWRLTIPAGPSSEYRWAQLDDYLHLPRSRFHWQAPIKLEVSARVSDQEHRGTWGFGFWNDPFNASLGIAGASNRLPALPNAAWFFFASPHNYLSLRDDTPANGMLAGIFSSPRIHSLLLAPGALALPLMLSRRTIPLLRRILRIIIKEDANQPAGVWTEWHDYAFTWKDDEVIFELDGKKIFQTAVSPRGKLGLVIWIDNQYANFSPNQRFKSGKLKTESESWMEIRHLALH